MRAQPHRCFSSRGAMLLAGLLFLAAPRVRAQDAPADDIARIRKATEAFRALDAAVAAGYSRDGGRCLANLPTGTMGFHHQNDALMDDKLELLRPEILVYERLVDGSYRLNGIEYVVPFTVWPRTKEPPTILSQSLKLAPSLGIWYLHVWVWNENPSGMFADWHPHVQCPGRVEAGHAHPVTPPDGLDMRVAGNVGGR